MVDIGNQLLLPGAALEVVISKAREGKEGK